MKQYSTLRQASSSAARLALIFLFLLPVAKAHGQTPKRVPFFELSATTMGVEDLPPIFYLDVTYGSDGREQRQFLPLPVSSSSRGSLVKPAFLPGVTLYTGDFDAAGQPQMKPYLNVPARSEGSRLLLVFHLDAKGKPQTTFLDDSADAHPAGTVRMVNFSPQRIAFTAGGAPVLVPPGGNALSRPVMTGEDHRFSFKHFVERPGAARYESPEKILRFRDPQSRLLVVFTPMPDYAPRDDPEAPPQLLGYTPVAYRLQDTLKPL